MEVKAENVRFENILTKGQFIIPDYQREYDWEEPELNEFIEDIDELNSGDKHFMGHMVFEGDFNGDKFFVIDGQQRITTITILLCVIRDHLYKLNSASSKKLADAIHNKYIFSQDKEGDPFEVLKNDMPYPILQAYVQNKFGDKDDSKKPKKEGEKKIVKAYDKFIKHFEKSTENELVIARNKLLNLEVIFVAVKSSEDGDTVDAHEIFMTLNATGKDLTAFDLIKSRIFKLYPKKVHINEPNDTWKDILKNINNEDSAKKSGDKSKKFLNNFWSSRYKKVKNEKIFKDFVKEIIKPKREIKTFLKELLEDSILFKKIEEPNKNDWKNDNEFKIFLSLDAITQVFGIDVANPILLALLREYKKNNISLTYLIKALNCIERYHFINNAITSGRSSGLDHKYSKYGRELLIAKDKTKKHIVIDGLIKSLNNNLPQKSLFEASFDKNLFYTSKKTNRKKLVQYVLKKLELKQNPNSDLLNVSIEHIFPEKPKRGLIKLEDELIANIGNLALLDRKLNSDERIGNNSFEIKKPIIEKESHIITTKKIFTSNTTWGKKEINKRKIDLIEELYSEVWL